MQARHLFCSARPGQLLRSLADWNTRGPHSSQDFLYGVPYKDYPSTRAFQAIFLEEGVPRQCISANGPKN